MSSSIREKINSVEKQKKVQRRLIKEQMDATKKREKPKNNQPEYKEVEERKIPTETSSGDSIIESKEEVKKTTNKKSKKKTSKKK
jgi:hypothetical protein|tara:strand:+ start:124 stop:378 length:255 start_codon:yes stop_codon:yes gene_type:complete